MTEAYIPPCISPTLQEEGMVPAIVNVSSLSQKKKQLEKWQTRKLETQNNQ